MVFGLHGQFHIKCTASLVKKLEVTKSYLINFGVLLYTTKCCVNILYLQTFWYSKLVFRVFFCLANLPYKRASVEKYLALYESVNIIQNAKSLGFSYYVAILLIRKSLGRLQIAYVSERRTVFGSFIFKKKKKRVLSASNGL